VSNPDPIELDVTVRDEASEPLDKIAAKTDQLETAETVVDVETTGVPKTTDQLQTVEDLRRHITESPAVLDIQSDFAAARGDLEAAEQHLDRVKESAGGAKGEIAGLAAQAVAQVPGIDQATGQMVSAFGAVAESASSLGPAGVAAGTVAALAVFGVAKGAEQAKARTDELTSAFNDLAKASDAAFTKQSQQVWADAILRSALDGKKLADQFRDLAESSPAVARRMLDQADAIGLNANAQKLLSTAITDAEAATAQAKKTQDQYGESATAAAGKQDALAASTAAAGSAAAAAKATTDDYIRVLETIPPAKRTEFLAAVNRGDAATANAILDGIADPRTAVINVAVRAANIGAQIGAMVRGAAAAAGGSVVSVTNVNLPAGSRGIDALREVNRAQRRAGTRYGSAAVSRARR
jgi:hypothetical protein